MIIDEDEFFALTKYAVRYALTMADVRERNSIRTKLLARRYALTTKQTSEIAKRIEEKLETWSSTDNDPQEKAAWQHVLSELAKGMRAKASWS